MDLKHLEEFVALAETGNYLEASDELFISQSTLSKHIMALEKELGVSLFERTTRKVRLSSDGECFLPYAVKITQLGREAANVLDARAKAGRDRITVASTSQMVLYGVTEALAQYKRTHLSCQLNVLVEAHKNLKQLLYQEKADFIWIGEPSAEAKERDLVRIPFLLETLVALVPKEHPLAALKRINIDELKKYELIMQDNTSIEQEVFVSLCQKRGFQPKVISIPGGQVMVDFVRQGLGVAVMLKTPACRTCGADVSMLELESGPIIQVNLLYLKGRKLSPVALEFLHFLQKWNGSA